MNQEIRRKSIASRMFVGGGVTNRDVHRAISYLIFLKLLDEEESSVSSEDAL
jgi:hypothetical protein